jgi:hypothetical protein
LSVVSESSVTGQLLFGRVTEAEWGLKLNVGLNGQFPEIPDEAITRGIPIPKNSVMNTLTPSQRGAGPMLACDASRLMIVSCRATTPRSEST